MTLYKYTPGLVEPEILKKTLMGRTEELKSINRILRSASAGKSISHPILIGPRGIGKTHILRIIYHAVRGDIIVKNFKNYSDYFIPIISPEEEYVDTLEQFLLLILGYLRNDGIDVPEELFEASILGDKEREIAVSYLKSFKKKTGKILLILIDNIDAIIGSLTVEDQAGLRDILMTSGSVLLIGAAPTLFGAIEDHDKPFYNFFETIWIDELSFEEIKELLANFAEIENRKDLIKEFKESEPKLRAIYELAGGNPRLALSFFEIVAEGDVPSVEKTFLRMLDEHSAYFRERMRDLPNQQRVIIDVIARAEELLTPTEIASKCKVPVNIVNSQLKRLEDSSYVKKYSRKGKRRVYYDLREKLFSIWRQMRVEAGRKRLDFLVRFYQIWFTEKELLSLMKETITELTNKLVTGKFEEDPLIDKFWYLKEALGKSKFSGILDITFHILKGDIETVRKESARLMEENPNDYNAWFVRAGVYTIDKKHDKAITAYKRGLEMEPGFYVGWYSLGNEYLSHKKYSKAIDSYKKVLEVNSKFYFAWVAMGNTYAAIEKYKKAITAYKKAIKITPDDFAIWNQLGFSYLQLKKMKESINCLEKALRLNPDNEKSFAGLGAVYLINFADSVFKEKEQDAISNLRTALHYLSKSPEYQELYVVFASILQQLLAEKKINLIKMSLNEIENVKQKELLEFLSPYSILINYLETKDSEILDRLRREDRIIVEEMLKTYEAKPKKKTIRKKKAKTVRKAAKKKASKK